jgi:hypothetical protein
MTLSLGELHCVFCHSWDVRCTEWFPDLAKDPVEHWSLEDPVPAYAQSNFSDTGDITLLVNCRTCHEWFQFDARSHKVTFRNLPMSPKYDDLPPVVVEVDPLSLALRALHIGSRRIVAKGSTLDRGERYEISAGPFYPYPRGAYTVECAYGESAWDHQVFRARLSTFFTPSFLSAKDGDLPFYQTRFEWVDERGAVYLRELSSVLKREEEAMLDEATRRAEKQASDPDEFCQYFSDAMARNDVWASARSQTRRAAGSARNVVVYRFLDWFEGQLRQYVWQSYIDKYKPDAPFSKWWKGCFPQGVRQNIENNIVNARRLDRRQAVESPLDYADFDDLMELIEKEWTFLNQRLGSDIRAVRGHFEYIKHTRNAVAHMRHLSHDGLMVFQDNVIRFAELLGAKFFQDTPFPFYQRPHVLE